MKPPAFRRRHRQAFHVTIAAFPSFEKDLDAVELLTQLIDLARYLLDVFLHLDTHLNEMAIYFGPWLYLILFLIIFAETGLVVTPFLPGDSLLFAVGALAAIDGSPLNVHLIGALLYVAAVGGDATNYAIGCRIGPRVFTAESSRLLNRQYLLKAQAFYEKHGGKTIIIARFIPIVRTFAPFVAGIGRMRYPRFATFNLVGAALWIPPFLYAGYWLGNVPAVKRNFHIIIVVIVLISVMPAVLEYLKARRAALKQAPS
jgi:membrane-associated protein